MLLLPNENDSVLDGVYSISMPDIVTGTCNGVNINEINQTNIIKNYIWITYSDLSIFPLPNICHVPLASNLIRIPKLRHLLMRGQ